MTQVPTLNVPGRSGQHYTYGIYPKGTTFTKVPGNYIFVRQLGPNLYKPLYIGETGDLSTRFDNHHKMDHIKMHGVTHICVHQAAANDAVRRAEESDLVAQWNPPCNG